MTKDFPRFKVHPKTLEAFRLGHPWMTFDSFNKKFPHDAPFIIALDEKGKERALILHDPTHREIKGRLWSLKAPFTYKQFQEDLKQRIKEAIKKRIDLKILEEREDLYLCFSEADFLPGILILMLKNHILIQIYSTFWTTQKKLLLKTIKEELKFSFPKKSFLFSFQMRGNPQKYQAEKEIQETTFKITEFEIDYQISLGKNYDFGLYPDMANIRKLLAPTIKSGDHMLNLFSYTGAFSLLGLKKKCNKVISVDLSRKHLDLLIENIKLNPDLDLLKHQDLCMSVELALKNLANNKETFDIIICDPPSAFSDKEKKHSALKMYEKDLLSILSLLKRDAHAFIFLNTHKVSIKKWKAKIENTLKEAQNTYKIVKNLELSADCPRRPFFEEGNYLKGLVIKRIF